MKPKKIETAGFWRIRDGSSFRSKLTAWRRAQKLSQSQAALKLGVTIDTLQNWEQGRHIPRPFVLRVVLGIVDKGN